MAQTDRTTGLVGHTGIKQPVRAATTANITLSGEQTIDGVAVVTDDRVLVKDQTTTSENGIWVCDTGAWERAKDINGSYDIVKGTMVRVTDGSTLADSIWTVSTENPITIGTTGLSFTQVNNALLGVSAFIQTLLDEADAAALRNSIGIAWCGTATGTANALVLTPAQAITALVAGIELVFKASASANTAATTIAVSGLTATAVQTNGDACVGGEIEASKWYRATYDGAAFQLEKLASAPFTDANPLIHGSADSTKKVRFEADGLTTGTTRVITMPDRDLTLDSPVNITGNAQSSTYTAIATDKGKVIVCTGTFTLNLTTSATLGAGWWCWVKNASTGVTTVTAAGSETISIAGGPETPASSITLPYSGSVEGPYNISGILLWCDGTNFEALGTLEAHGAQEFLSSSTWTCPAGVTAAWVSASGGGGGGGAARSATTGGAGGGGAGNAVTGVKVATVPGTAYTVTIGAAGAAGATDSGTGGTGGTTSIGALVSVTGGNGGVGQSTNVVRAGGAVNGRGGAGFPGDAGYAGNGGSGPFGGGGQGAAGDGAGGAATANSGAGGGGAYDSNDAASAGGAGGSGYLRVEW